MEIRSESPTGHLLAVHPLTPPQTPTHTRSRKVCSVRNAERSRRRQSRFDELVAGFNVWLSTRPLPPTTHSSPVTHPLPPTTHSSPVTRPLPPTTHFSPVTHPLPPTTHFSPVTHPLPPTTHSSPVTRPLPPTTHFSPVTDQPDDRLDSALSDGTSHDTLTRRVFSDWRLAVYLGALEQLVLQHLTQQRTALLRGVLCEWQRRVRVCSGERELLTRLSTLRQHRLCRAALLTWLKAVRLQQTHKFALQRHWSHWRRHLHSHKLARKCQERASMRPVSHCFTVWREVVEWSNTRAALSFVERLQQLLTPDPAVSYRSMVTTLTQTSRNLQLTAPLLSDETFSSEEVKGQPGSRVGLSSLEATPTNEPPPPVIAMATVCIRQLQRHKCSRPFEQWRLYCQVQLERAIEWSKWRTVRRLFECWQDLASLRKQEREMDRERDADQLHRGRSLCRVWSVWRCALVRERVSQWGVSSSRRLLLSQVFTAWQSTLNNELY